MSGTKLESTSPIKTPGFFSNLKSLMQKYFTPKDSEYLKNLKAFFSESNPLIRDNPDQYMQRAENLKKSKLLDRYPSLANAHAKNMNKIKAEKAAMEAIKNIGEQAQGLSRIADGIGQTDRAAVAPESIAALHKRIGKLEEELNALLLQGNLSEGTQKEARIRLENARVAREYYVEQATKTPKEAKAPMASTVTTASPGHSTPPIGTAPAPSEIAAEKTTFKEIRTDIAQFNKAIRTPTEKPLSALNVQELEAYEKKLSSDFNEAKAKVDHFVNTTADAINSKAGAAPEKFQLETKKEHTVLLQVLLGGAEMLHHEKIKEIQQVRAAKGVEQKISVSIRALDGAITTLDRLMDNKESKQTIVGNNKEDIKKEIKKHMGELRAACAQLPEKNTNRKTAEARLKWAEDSLKRSEANISKKEDQAYNFEMDIPAESKAKPKQSGVPTDAKQPIKKTGEQKSATIPPSSGPSWLRSGAQTPKTTSAQTKTAASRTPERENTTSLSLTR